MEAAAVARHLVDEVICRLGIPDAIHMDCGKNFLIRGRTTPYHLQSDGLVSWDLRYFTNTSTGILDKHPRDHRSHSL